MNFRKNSIVFMCWMVINQKKNEIKMDYLKRKINIGYFVVVFFLNELRRKQQ